MSKVLDFDRFREEAENETILVRAYGMEMTVRKAIPAIVTLMAARAEKLADQSSRNQAYVKMVVSAAQSLFGEDNLNALCEKGLTAGELNQLTMQTINLINGEDGDEDEPQELSDADSRSELPGDSAKK